MFDSTYIRFLQSFTGDNATRRTFYAIFLRHNPRRTGSAGTFPFEIENGERLRRVDLDSTFVLE